MFIFDITFKTYFLQRQNAKFININKMFSLKRQTSWNMYWAYKVGVLLWVVNPIAHFEYILKKCSLCEAICTSYGEKRTWISFRDGNKVEVGTRIYCSHTIPDFLLRSVPFQLFVRKDNSCRAFLLIQSGLGIVLEVRTTFFVVFLKMYETSRRALYCTVLFYLDNLVSWFINILDNERRGWKSLWNTFPGYNIFGQTCLQDKRKRSNLKAFLIWIFSACQDRNAPRKQDQHDGEEIQKRIMNKVYLCLGPNFKDLTHLEYSLFKRSHLKHFNCN